MKNYTTEIKWAAIFTIASILWMLIEKMTGLHDTNIGKQPVYSMLFAIPAIAIYFLALLDKKKTAFNGVMGWKEGLISGMILSVFVAVLSPMAQWVSFTMISPEYFPNAIKFYTNKHLMTEAKAIEYFNFSSFMKKGVFDALSMGVITSALVAFIVQTKTPKP